MDDEGKEKNMNQQSWFFKRKYNNLDFLSFGNESAYMVVCVMMDDLYNVHLHVTFNYFMLTIGPGLPNEQ